MIKKNKKIALIAGGGTGGHLFPAITIGKKLEEENITVKYIGSKYGIEKNIFKNLKAEYFLLNIKGIKRGNNLKSIVTNLSFPFRFINSYFQLIKIILKLKPCIIIGTGGYCSGIPLLAGTHFNIPTLIQDQNSIPGLITKILHKKVKKVCLAYDIASKNLNNSIITGNPIRIDLEQLNKK